MFYLYYLWILINSIWLRYAYTKSIPGFDYGGKSREEFLRDAIGRSSPGTARLLAELFGGLELGIDFGGETKAVISVGGAATRCQHQSPCFDSDCGLCYDPLLRIHGRCGGASYFTCRGTLPENCLPYTCTATPNRDQRARDNNGEELSSKNEIKSTVFIKKFSKLNNPFCVDDGDRDVQNRSENEVIVSEDEELQLNQDRTRTVIVPEGVTPCQSFDLCLDLRCGLCYDPYLGSHTSCGKMTYYDCLVTLPDECRPIRCTHIDIDELLITSEDDNDDDGNENPLMVRNFPPIESTKKCL